MRVLWFAGMLPLRDDNPTRTFPIVTLAFITLNIAFFFYEISLPPALLQDLVFRRGLVPGLVTSLPGPGLQGLGSGLLSFVSSMFLHGDFLHLGGNMLYLWIFGNNIEDRLGHGRFILFYGLCGLAASMTQIASLPESMVPMIGASGAIAGVLGAYLLLFPKARVLTVIPIFIFLHFVRLPAYVVLGLWFVFQVVHSLMADPGRGGVAWFAHVGGFVMGMLLLYVFLPRRRPPARRSAMEARVLR
jgi:membrane associated rhomboid family serine protease